MSGKEIVILNEEGRSWNFNMTYNKARMHTFVRPGWRRFCAQNSMNKGHHYTFKLYIPRKFMNANGLERFSDIILKNEWGGRWTLGLRHYDVLNHTYLGPGWQTFCQVNGIKAEDSFMLKLVETGGKPFLLLCSSNRGKTPLECSEDSDDVNSLSSDTSSGNDSREESQESEEESSEDEGSSHENFEMEKMKSSSSYRASSSFSQRFVKLTLTQRALKAARLTLPLGFTRVNGINKPRKITLLGKDGVKKQVDLLQHNRFGIMRIGKGWKEFCEDHGVKVRESFLLELIWDEEAIPVLKFSTKL
ncbi:unnamed protein product [Eruca vesicaria subsp. sativa]|uniref:TF-B3 domain-containing protein n=1 Tax=Eruca vesicaria subsp. sativa TaxID=29727 RepID=A0ABC8M3I1_ERUVS|nr:unnamed protein product [Eruca vesicaria subsp. sativa]